VTQPLFPGYTSFKTVQAVTPSDFEQGWELLQIIPSQTLQSVFEEVGEVRFDRNYVVNCVLFLLGMREQYMLKGLNEKLKAAKDTVEAQKKAMTETERAKNMAEVECSRARKEIERLNEAQGELVQEREAKRKMEADLAKLRTHFGEKAIKEALKED